MKFLDRMKEIAADVTGGLVSNQIAEERMAICHLCPFLTHPMLRCQQCGCFMSAKTKLKHAKCPIGKWEERV